MEQISIYNKQLINLFHIFVENPDEEKIDTSSFISSGIIFVNEKNEIINKVNKNIVLFCNAKFGLSQDKWNMTFHKTLEKVAFEDLNTLILEQLIHYFSTYGLENLGYKAIPFIPYEKVDKEHACEASKYGFSIFKLVSAETAIQYINNYLAVTHSPNKLVISDITSLINFATINVDNIASYELKIIYYDKHNTVPKDGQEFLRYLIYKLTNSTLLIKNNKLINLIKWKAMFEDTKNIAKDAFAKANYVELAKIFYRYKPLFLAFKEYPDCAPIINKIRRLAKKYHQPLSDVNVQNFSKLLLEERYDDVAKVLTKASNRQIIKLYNYFKNRNTENNIEIYNIRNGKTFVNTEKHNNSIDSIGVSLLKIELNRRFKDKLKGQKFLIPSYINYAAPISEKQFTGNIPWGTKINCPNKDNFSLGIYWENYNGLRTDLDLHLTGLNQSYGWNASWRTEDDVLFSGDMTDATNGAAEVFYIKNKNDKYILSVSNFTANNNVPFQFLISEKNFDKTINKNGSRPTSAPINIEEAIFPPIELAFKDNNDMFIGLLNNNQFIFYGGELGNLRVPNRELYKDTLESLVSRIEHLMPLKEILIIAGAEIYDEQTILSLEEEDKKNIIDLSPNNLLSTTLIEFIDLDEKA